MRDDKTGNLFGTTVFGGKHDYGTVFKLTPEGQETVLHSFKNDDAGKEPVAGLVRDSAGNLYGAASYVLFRVSPTGAYDVLHELSFDEGGDIEARLLLDQVTGDLYGTANVGGRNNCGTVFKFEMQGGFKVLHNFAGGKDDGCDPAESGVVVDASGNLFGATSKGGGTGGGRGVVYKLAPDGIVTVLHRFRDSDGKTPSGGVVLDGLGNLYGTTRYGGTGSGCGDLSCGVFFKISPDGAYTVLHDFGVETDDGVFPSGNLLLDPSGTIYGRTTGGGSRFYGVVYSLKPSGRKKVLHNFGKSMHPPSGGLIADENGNLYGTTALYSGAVFELVK